MEVVHWLNSVLIIIVYEGDAVELTRKSTIVFYSFLSILTCENESKWLSRGYISTSTVLAIVSVDRTRWDQNFCSRLDHHTSMTDNLEKFY